jgi:hypothetical protein
MTLNQFHLPPWPIPGPEASARNKIIVVAIGPVTLKYIDASLKPLGLEPVFITETGHAYEGASGEVLNRYEHHEADIFSLASIQKVLEENPHLASQAKGIYSFYDSCYPAIDCIAKKHGLLTPEPGIVLLSEKDYLYQLIPEHCPKFISFKPHQLDDLDVAPLAGAKDLILKPSLAGGADGICRLQPGASLNGDIREAIKRCILADAWTQTWILQERIPGRLMSLEGYAHNGQLYFIGFSLRTRVDLTEMSNEFPADEHFPETVRGQCRDAIRNLVDRARLRNGYFHCEFIYDRLEQKALLIDGNFGRVSGGAAVEQFSRSYGLDPRDVLRHVTMLPLEPDLVPSPFPAGPVHRRKTRAIYLGLDQATTFQDIQFPSDSACDHTRYLGAGQQVLPVGHSDLSWVGVISGLQEDVVREIEQITIQTSDGPRPPVYAILEPRS